MSTPSYQFAVQPIPFEPYTAESSFYDGPKCQILETEALIEQRVSVRLTQELNEIQQQKEKEYQMQLEQERMLHQKKQDALRQEIIR